METTKEAVPVVDVEAAVPVVLAVAEEEETVLRALAQGRRRRAWAKASVSARTCTT